MGKLAGPATRVADKALVLWPRRGYDVGIEKKSNNLASLFGIDRGRARFQPRREVRVLDRLGTVAVVGVGLIGGSIGLALRGRGLASTVVGVGRDMRALDEARSRGVIDRATTDLAEGVAEADVVVVCTPVGRIALDVRRAAEAAPRTALITDAGSTKRRIVEEVEQTPRAAEQFVAAHPLAGSERSGSAFARADLFRDRVCVLTPSPRARSGRPWDAEFSR